MRDGLTMGRVAGCDIVIDDTKASRRHARILVQGGVVEIEDLGSSNGTLLNGKPVQRRIVRDGDQIQIGATTIVYVERAASPAAKAAADDVDLFGEDEGAPSASQPAADEDDLDVSAPPAPQPPIPSRPAAPPRATVEFADEVVEVRKQSPLPRAAGSPAQGAEPQLAQKQRVLQYSQQKASGPLGDDLSQMSSGSRNVIVVLVLLGAAGLAWALMNLVS